METAIHARNIAYKAKENAINITLERIEYYAGLGQTSCNMSLSETEESYLIEKGFKIYRNEYLREDAIISWAY